MVRITGGPFSKVVGTNLVIICKYLTLDSVIFCFKLDCNLLCISNLTHEKNHVTKIFPNHCVF